MNEKQILKILLGLIITLFGHNLYLNYKLHQVSNNLNKVREYSISASNSASEAEFKAEKAMENSKNAEEYSEEAVEHSFGENCYSCP